MSKFRHFLLARSEVSEHTCGARVYTAQSAVCEGGLALTKPGRGPAYSSGPYEFDFTETTIFCC
jgi:hypothetical protein